MPVSESTSIKRLSIDLSNYRTTRQKDERHAVEAIIAINPDWFWALTESLLDDGYLPTENVLVQRTGSGSKALLTVKEGNRRVSALKIIHGLIPTKDLSVPANILERIATVATPAWKKANLNLPCVVYGPEEADIANRIRSLTHGKGEKAGRDKWTAVARARHNRDENKASEPALDVLEKYLKHGANLTTRQAQLWSGDYPLSVLEEALKRMSTRLGCLNSTDVGKKYPNKVQHRLKFDEVIFAIGQKSVTFDSLRTTDVATAFGIPDVKLAPSSSSGTTASAGTGTAGAPAPAPAAAAATGKKVAAVAVQDPRRVARALRDFTPKGQRREKVVSLLVEIRRLKLDKNPIAFCFLLRSMFEISAKAYCTDHKSAGLSTTKNGIDRKLLDVLRDVTKHLTNNSADQAMLKALHGSLTELAKPEGILSVTSMNQLVHNPTFSQQPQDIAVLFGNVFPLVEAMNA
ncbi:hypothetical protein [Methylibium sp. Root1272]|uniref:hypothetical protein n=1 Tax=Methylibium sp. Root1272 TaxID=1736441 RepID=UPI0006F8E4B1|nr:hypothetical protein [Methylibium sp. Root1272]KQW75247.1 hypothetical protein ASC67_18360 [Methylibium sp. Root1272]